MCGAYIPLGDEYEHKNSYTERTEVSMFRNKGECTWFINLVYIKSLIQVSVRVLLSWFIPWNHRLRLRRHHSKTVAFV